MLSFSEALFYSLLISITILLSGKFFFFLFVKSFENLFKVNINDSLGVRSNYPKLIIKTE